MRMRPIYDPVCLEHDTGAHPECAARLAGAGFEEERVAAAEEALSLVHTPEHIERVRAACERGGMLDADTVVSQQSWDAAVRAVGATLQAAEEGGFAITRPPGHHAAADRSAGFCLFNNVAIAARHLANAGKRVLIFDFDGHLGDGTSAIFAEDDQVLYWSIHQYPAYPGGGAVSEIGRGKGEGFTVNVPLPPGSGDDLFLRGIRHTLPVAKAFAPDVVAVSAGFDAHRVDPLLELRVTTAGFHEVGRLLAAEFDSVFATLEGGYDPTGLRRSIHAFLDGFDGGSTEELEKPSDSSFKLHDEFDMRLCHLEESLAPHWRF